VGARDREDYGSRPAQAKTLKRFQAWWCVPVIQAMYDTILSRITDQAKTGDTLSVKKLNQKVLEVWLK
jgi:hypothetical protein